MSKTLVKSPDAIAFSDQMGTEAFRKARLGDPAAHDRRALNAINDAHGAIKDGLAKIAGLVDDPTKTEVVKHEVGQKVAERTVATLERSRASIIKTAAELDSEATSAIETAFKLKPEREGIHAEMRAYIRDAASKGELNEIRRIMDSDHEAASVLVNTPHWLLKLASEAHGGLFGDAVKRHVPGGAEAYVRSRDLTELAGKYEKVITGVKSSFYVPALAEQAKLRVEA